MAVLPPKPLFSSIWRHQKPKFVRTNAAFVRTNAAFVRTVAAFVRTVAAFVRTVAAFVRTVATFVRTVAAFVRTVAAFVRTVAAFVRTVAAFVRTIAASCPAIFVPFVSFVVNPPAGYFTFRFFRRKVGTSRSWPSTMVGSDFSKRPRLAGSSVICSAFSSFLAAAAFSTVLLRVL